MTDRAAYLTSLIGKPWAADGEGPDAWHCWALAQDVQARLFGLALPKVVLPEPLTRRWMMQTLATHDEARRWQEVPPLDGIIRAGDGALVSMARLERPCHVGVYLRAEGGIIHADDRHGVILEAPARLRARGWGRLRYHERVPA